MSRSLRVRRLLALCALLGGAAQALADELPEYRLKAAFIYNFANFTEWPADVGPTLNLCILGADPFGKEIDGLQGKAVGGRNLSVYRRASSSALAGCQIVFVASSVIGALPRVLEAVTGAAVLTVADSPGAARQGVALNMAVSDNRITFEANLVAARAARLNLSSRLLRLATEVQQ